MLQYFNGQLKLISFFLKLKMIKFTNIKKKSNTVIMIKEYIWKYFMK